MQQATLNGDRAEMDRQLDRDPRLILALDYDKNTLLHLAVLRKNPIEVADLLNRRANVDAVNTAGMAPIHIAAKQGDAAIVRLLLTHHPNLTLRDSRGLTPLAWAVRARRESVIQLLRAAGVQQ